VAFADAVFSKNSAPRSKDFLGSVAAYFKFEFAGGNKYEVVRAFWMPIDESAVRKAYKVKSQDGTRRAKGTGVIRKQFVKAPEVRFVVGSSIHAFDIDCLGAAIGNVVECR
jgi:hypothetical protein